MPAMKQHTQAHMPCLAPCLRVAASVVSTLLVAAMLCPAAAFAKPRPSAQAKSRTTNKPHNTATKTTAAGPAWWIHRDGDQPLGWAFGKHLNEARKRHESVIVMFTADWCSPCKAIKDLVAGSAVVRGAFRKHKGRLLYIDVDEWRGPAHRLIPGVYPRKLPTLVRIDGSGQKVLVAYGSELGLLSEDAVATNFGLLIDGKPMIKPFYEGDSAKQTALLRAQHTAREARNNHVKTLVVERMKGAKVRLRIRNLDGPRRWFLIPIRANAPLAEAPQVGSVTTMKFNEHVRATYLRFDGKTAFIAMPVAGYGDVDLVGWPLPGAAKTLEVWELNRLEVDGQARQFDQKLPYHQIMKQAGAATAVHDQPVKSVKLFVKQKISARIR